MKRLLTALGVLALLTGCGSAGGEARSGSETELRLAIGGESEDGYDPTLGWGSYGSPLFQSTLLKRDADLGIVNDLATGHEVSEDGLTWTVTIRDDARFTDGEPVTADDVAYTFSTAATSGGTIDVTALESATAIDETTVELRLKRPQSTFVNRLISLGIVPEHAHGDDYGRNPVGSGPFELVQWDRGQQLIVQRNDDYYGELPAFERIVFLFSDEDTALAQAQAGEVQVAGVPSLLAHTEVPGMELVSVDSVDNRGFSLPTVPAGGTHDGRPVGNDVTADAAVRQAINVAVDREALVDGVLEGFGSTATGPADGTPWANPEVTVDDADPGAAGELLDEAGWTDEDGDGVREKDGTPAAFDLLYPAGDSLRQGLALAVAEQVRPAGIRIKARGADWEEIESRWHADAVLFGWGAHDPTELYTLHTTRGAGDGYTNPGFYDDPRAQQHLDAAMTAISEEDAIGDWQQAQAQIAEDVPWVWLVNLDHTYFVSDCLDLGATQTEPHGHGWPITAGITGWTWTC